MKFLLLLNHKDLTERGQQFRESIKAFSDFLGVFNNGSDEELLNLSSSIGIVITKATVMDLDEGLEKTIEYLKEGVNERLTEILNAENEAKKLEL